MSRSIPKTMALAFLLSCGAILAAPAPPSPVASSDGETPGHKVDVTELKRTSGGTISLKLTLVNDSDKRIGFGTDFADKANSGKDNDTVGGITLIDPVGRKKYFVVRDSDGNCVCSRGLRGVEPRSRMNLWAKFPAPPEGVKKITIEVPHFAPMDDVPIAQ